MKRLLLVAFLVACLLTQAQTERGPHNGVVASAGDYKVEVLGCNEYLEVYLYDKFMGPLLNYGITGDVKFFKEENVGTGSKLVNYGNDGFTAKFPDYPFAFFKVTFKIQSVTYSATFKNECLIAN